ncbi:MAG: nucleotidyltransferase domain-containing protein [Nanoarchaeota archaeon]|nr:nucleotidyltransferase domain-containing protein [Nanoarchaeota archaeon]
MIAQIFNKDMLEVLTVFSISPGSKFLRKELKERTKLNNANLDNAINILLNSNLIKKEKRFWSLNFDNAKYIIKLILDEYKALRELPLNVYFSIINVVFFLSKFKYIDVYLFGSYAKLVFKDTSDIDILIISDKIINNNKKEINKLTQKLESRYEKKIEIHYFGTNFYKNKKDPFVQEVMKNGLRLI